MRSPARLIGNLLSGEHVGYAAVQSILLQILTLAVNVATGVATARALGVEGRGLYAAATALPMLLGLVAVAGMEDGVLVQLRRKRELAASTVLVAYAAALVTSAALATASFLALPHYLGRHYAADVGLCRAALFFLPLAALIALTRSVFQGHGRYLLANLTTFLPNLFHAVAIGALVAGAALSVQTALAGLILGYLASLGILLFLVIKQTAGPVRAPGRALASLWAFGRRAAPGDVASLLTGWADRLILVPLLSAQQLGLYVVALSVAQLVTVATPATGILLSAMAHAPPAKAKALHDTSLRLSIACLGALVVVLLPIAQPIITLVYGPGFAKAAIIFEVLVIRSAAVRIANVTGQLYLASNRPGLHSTFRFAEFALAVALLLTLVPAGGAMGAAIALLTATLARLGLLWIGLVTHLRLEFPRLRLNRDDLHAVQALFAQRRQADGDAPGSGLLCDRP